MNQFETFKLVLKKRIKPKINSNHNIYMRSACKLTHVLATNILEKFKLKKKTGEQQNLNRNTFILENVPRITFSPHLIYM